MIQSEIKLTRNEKTVLQMTAEGRRQMEIADEIRMSDGMVREYLSELRQKFEVRNNNALIYKVTKMGLI